MKNIIFATIICLLVSQACQRTRTRNTEKSLHLSESTNQIAISESERRTLYKGLLNLTNIKNISGKSIDSSAFLIIPIDASCPFCRDKCIKTLIKYLDNLPSNHFVIITGNSMKEIKSYFNEKGINMPVKPGQVFIDSENRAYLNDLVFLHPTFYYSVKDQIHEKVKTVPLTIKEDLKRFFYLDS